MDERSFDILFWGLTVCEKGYVEGLTDPDYDPAETTKWIAEVEDTRAKLQQVQARNVGVPLDERFWFNLEEALAQLEEELYEIPIEQIEPPFTRLSEIQLTREMLDGLRSSR
jgi:hypothetical protein